VKPQSYLNVTCLSKKFLSPIKKMGRKKGTGRPGSQNFDKCNNMLQVDPSTHM